jgi:hypothetical protein
MRGSVKSDEVCSIHTPGAFARVPNWIGAWISTPGTTGSNPVARSIATSALMAEGRRKVRCYYESAPGRSPGHLAEAQVDERRPPKA